MDIAHSINLATVQLDTKYTRKKSESIDSILNLWQYLVDLVCLFHQDQGLDCGSNEMSCQLDDLFGLHIE